MTVAKRERRRDEEGSLICENGHLRLRVFRTGRSLGLALDTCGLDMLWGSLGLVTTGEAITCRTAAGIRHTGYFFAFDPIVHNGRTRGVNLHGHLGEAVITLTALLDDESTWCRHRLTVTGLTDGVSRLTQRWRLFPDDLLPEICWPASAVQGDALAYTPAVFLQGGTVLAALVGEFDDEDPTPFGAEVTASEQLTLEYGIWDGDACAWTPRTPCHLAYTLGLDARALPERGFQQVARLLGSRDELALVGRSTVQPNATPPPALPATPAPAEWRPFVWEGTPAAIAAAVQHHLARARHDDWQALEDGLCWLDRLCLHQRTISSPADGTLGAFGPDDNWQQLTAHMPALLLQAFRLTGIPEYGFRAQAALRALPPDRQAAVLAQLRPAFGDCYVQGDFQMLVPLSGPEITDVRFTAEGIALEVAPSPAYSTLRLVLDGADEDYALILNGMPLGAFPTEELRTGVEIPITA